MPPLRYWALARALEARGHSVTWWTASWSHRKKDLRQLNDTTTRTTGFSVRLVPVRPYRRNVSVARIRSHRDFGRNLERVASLGLRSGNLPRPDILLASLPPFESCEATAKLAKTVGAPFILDVMDLWPETFARLVPDAVGLRRMSSMLFRGMKKRRDTLVATANGISAPCQAYAEAATANASTSATRHICYHGAEIEHFPSTPKAFDHAKSLLDCVYAGSLEPSQDIALLPRVAKLLSESGIAARIHIAGTGSRETALRRAADESQGSCQLIVHGLLESPAYVNLLSQCQVGLVCVRPDSMVAMPYKAGDYAAAGLAVVNSLPGELADMLNRYGAGVSYVAGSPESLASVIASLAADPPRLATTQLAARRMAENEFDRSKTYATFAEWIEGVHRGHETAI